MVAMVMTRCLQRLCIVHCHSDETSRDHDQQLKVDAMRPRVLSDPVSKPGTRSTTTTTSALQSRKVYQISRRGKLVCQETIGGSTIVSRTVVIGRNGQRQRAASASAFELGGRRRNKSFFDLFPGRSFYSNRVSWVVKWTGRASEGVAAALHVCRWNDLGVRRRRRHRTKAPVVVS